MRVLPDYPPLHLHVHLSPRTCITITIQRCAPLSFVHGRILSSSPPASRCHFMVVSFKGRSSSSLVDFKFRSFLAKCRRFSPREVARRSLALDATLLFPCVTSSPRRVQRFPSFSFIEEHISSENRNKREKSLLITSRTSTF